MSGDVAPAYVRHKPEQTLLYQLVEQYWPEFQTPLSARQVKPATADVEADGPDEPDQRAGRRKGLCCTEGRPAKRLKRVFNRAAQVGRPGIDVSVCSACGGPMGIIAESRTTALKIRWSLAKYCRIWKPQAVPYRQGQQSVLLEHAFISLTATAATIETRRVPIPIRTRAGFMALTLSYGLTKPLPFGVVMHARLACLTAVTV